MNTDYPFGLEGAQALLEGLALDPGMEPARVELIFEATVAPLVRVTSKMGITEEKHFALGSVDMKMAHALLETLGIPQVPPLRFVRLVFEEESFPWLEIVPVVDARLLSVDWGAMLRNVVEVVDAPTD